MLTAFMILEITFVNLFKFSCIGYLLFHIYVLRLDYCILEGRIYDITSRMFLLKRFIILKQLKYIHMCINRCIPICKNTEGYKRDL